MSEEETQERSFAAGSSLTRARRFLPDWWSRFALRDSRIGRKRRLGYPRATRRSFCSQNNYLARHVQAVVATYRRITSGLRVIQEQSGQSTCTTWRLHVRNDGMTARGTEFLGTLPGGKGCYRQHSSVLPNRRIQSSENLNGNPRASEGFSSMLSEDGLESGDVLDQREHDGV